MPSSEDVIVAGCRVRVDGLKARPELNGQLATVETLNEESGRWNVMIDDRREPFALKSEALHLVAEFNGLTIGTRVRIADIEKQPELNGKLGTVEGFHGERCTVYVDAVREKMQLKPSCLAVADEKNPTKRDGDEGDGCKVRVECNGVMLKLTLSEKQMEKPFAEAVLKPFLKAYSKKKGEEKGVGDVAQVTVDSDGQTELKVLNDIHIFSAEQV